ncbi:hypothetical protein N7476_011485 [Penicillium atrosanguineum]|uniref:Zn(2)-C6 fungal-type domain-containing protein n=1 Tax=Penicillium atrosanguineum TaxID=1132637 RepID=A0A9W9U026_9EURO|nr:hypothetical protein N7526_010768 [Penicillium atrosanguineum]KAJ5299928.1 hypothetical protein N7476_011485 [Penicillium atrosanguineum]
MSSRSNQACIRCRQQKRKCDKVLPVCALCKRLSRVCRYPVHEDSTEKHCGRPFYLPDSLDLTQLNISSTLEGQVSKNIGNGLQLHSAAATYFQTIHTWLPIISESLYFSRLSQARVGSAPADFSLLTLSMFLVCQAPVAGEISPRTRSIYVQIKSLYSMVETVGIISLDMLQCRLLITIFEVGHAMYPAAYISAGANVRAAVALGANKASYKQLESVLSHERTEEAQMTWQGLVMVDRYASLESGKGLSSVHMVSLENAGSQSTPRRLPVTGYNEQRHGCVSKVDFQHFLSGNGLIDNPSAMLELLDFGCHVNRPDSDICNMVSRNILTTMVDETVEGASSVLSNLAAANPDSLSVFIPHFICRTALLFLQELSSLERRDAALPIRTLMSLLEHISKKWVAGSMVLHNNMTSQRLTFSGFYADKVSKIAEACGLCR